MLRSARCCGWCQWNILGRFRQTQSWAVPGPGLGTHKLKTNNRPHPLPGPNTHAHLIGSLAPGTPSGATRPQKGPDTPALGCTNPRGAGGQCTALGCPRDCRISCPIGPYRGPNSGLGCTPNARIPCRDAWGSTPTPGLLSLAGHTYLPVPSAIPVPVRIALAAPTPSPVLATRYQRLLPPDTVFEHPIQHL